jgi:hypothetical protein
MRSDNCKVEVNSSRATAMYEAYVLSVSLVEARMSALCCASVVTRFNCKRCYHIAAWKLIVC